MAFPGEERYREALARAEGHEGDAAMAHIFGQGMHCLRANRWITTRGENEPHSYAWTDAGKLAYERGWYIPATHSTPYYLDAPPPATSTVNDEDSSVADIDGGEGWQRVPI